MNKREQTVLDTKKIRRVVSTKNRQNRFKLFFTVIEGNELDFGKIFDFNKKEIVIGRDKSCDIPLNDEKVSRTHCHITINAKESVEKIVIDDLGSTNGTHVNGEAIKHHALQSGDRIEIGSSIIRLSYSDEIEEKYHSRLFNLATLDPLTGIYSKRYILNTLENHGKIAKRNLRSFSLVMIDVDDFKKINDTHGHLAGDDYLKMVAFTINRVLREQDIFGRFGGEEFLIILPETEIKGAMILADRIRKKIERIELLFGAFKIRTTISLGVAQFGLHSDDPRVLLESADKALYHSKHAGKNRVSTEAAGS